MSRFEGLSSACLSIFIGALFYSFGLILFERWMGIQPGRNIGGVIGIGLLALFLIVLISGGTFRIKSDEEVLPDAKPPFGMTMPATSTNGDS